MNKRVFGLAIALAILVLAFSVPIAYGQGPVGPKQAIKSTFAVANSSADYDLIEVEQDFAPGSQTPVHTHGGPAYITVMSGELTLIQNGAQKTYKAGDTWTEKPGEFMQVVNRGTAPASTLVTFLLPKGAALTTNQAQAAPATNGAPASKQAVKSTFSVSNPPSDYDLIQVRQDFAPGSQTPVHTHGGPAYISVLSGELTLIQNGTQKTYKAGDTWTENPGEFMQVVNRGTEPASTFVTFLLPKGAPLTTNQPQAAPATNQAQAAPAANTATTPNWLLPTLGAAGLIILAGAGLVLRRRFVRR